MVYPTYKRKDIPSLDSQLVLYHNFAPAIPYLNTEQCLAESTRSFAEDFVWLHGDDGAEGVGEGVDVLHVQVVRRHGVGDRVVGEFLNTKLSTF